MPTIGELALIITAISGLILGVINYVQRGKTIKADKTKTNGEAAAAFAQAASMTADENIDLRRQVQDLDRKMKARDRQIAAWEKGIEILIKQLCDCGEKPAWTPAMVKVK